SALGYGITKMDLPEDKEKPRYVVIVDIGHSNYGVSIVAFSKGQLCVKATAYDRHFGGRNFDQVLVDYFTDVCKEKYKIDIKSNQKALFRLRTGCEKVKKVLSANQQAPLNVENLMNDIDVSSMIKRDEFERLASHLLDRVHAPLEQALKESGLTKEDIHSVEMVGGSSRIPAVKERISQFFGKELNFTLNQDEAIARGCAFQCAILSPVFKVRDFNIQDVYSYPIKVSWENIPEIPDEEAELLVFPKLNSIPSTKILTFHRKKPFDIEAHYADPDLIPPGINTWIGRFSIKNVEPTENDDLSIVKVKARLNLHGVLSVDVATVVEEVVKEEKEEVKTAEPQAKPTPKPANVKKVRKLVKKADLPVVSGTSSLDKSIVTLYRENEEQMKATDKLVIDTETQKNALEEYVYDMRGKVESSYSEYVDPAEKDTFLNLLNDTENWLYGDGEEATKSVYVSKLNDLKKFGDPIVGRYREAEERPKAEKQLRDSIQSFMLNATSNEERFAHISDEEKKSVVDKATQILHWLDEKIDAQSKLQKYEIPVVHAHEILKERDALVQYCSPIILRPKPKPEPKPAEPTAPETPAAGTQGAQGTPQETPATSQPEASARSDMDVD
ncbi:5190_t:CDS:2, partial [Ambispora leptoticha]